MAGKGSATPRRFLAVANERRPTRVERIAHRQRVMARVSHLIPRRQIEVERAVRLLRTHFVNRRRRSPMRGTLHWLMLVGDYTRAEFADRERGDISFYEIWAFVDHDAYKGMNRYWGLARRAVARALCGRAEIMLSVFTIDEPERFHAAGNRYLTSRYDGGIILYDRAMDGPKDAQGLAIEARLSAAIETLPKLPRQAFRTYREYGLIYRRIAHRLSVSEAQAEMHLADALGTMMAALDDDALPRSLRRLPRHPRHNLDLFHRPADYDRILAVAFYRRALAFAELMQADGAPRAIVVNSAAYAAELALKAVLLRAGHSDDWMRDRIGLEIEAALSHAIDSGLAKCPPGMRRLAASLAHYHSGGRSPALAASVEAAMPLRDVIATILDLLRSVGRTTGYSGLPAEEDA